MTPQVRTNTHLRIRPELLARLDDAARERVVGRNWLIVKLLEEGLDRLVPADELRLTRPPS